MSNLDRWAPWYHGLEPDEPQPYADTITYQLAADWVADCDTVQDWGCGKGWMRRLIPADRYVGVDGTLTPFCDIHADLATYVARPPVEGIVMRHVIEHDFRWQSILRTLNRSFTRRACIVLFTPLVARTTRIAFTPQLGVPDMAFRIDDVLAEFPDTISWVETIATRSQYDVETIIRLERT